MKLNLTFLAVPFAIAACGGGGSGISDSKRMADLSIDEARDLCHEFADDYPVETFTCPGSDQASSRGTDPADCDAADFELGVPAACPATVGQFRSCTDALYSLSDDEFCNLQSIPTECAFLADANCQDNGTARLSSPDIASRLRAIVGR